jgi:hypothetical protein
MQDGEIACDQQEEVSAQAMQLAIDSLNQDPEKVICAFNDGSKTKNFPVHYDLDRKDIAMPQDDLRTTNQGWTRAGECHQPGDIHAGIWLQTYVCALLPLHSTILIIFPAMGRAAFLYEASRDCTKCSGDS